MIAAADLDFLDGGQAPAPLQGTATVTDWLAGDLPGAVARLETAMLRRALAEAGGNRAEAARLLGIHRQLLYEKLRRYGLAVSENRTGAVGNPDAAPPDPAK